MDIVKQVLICILIAAAIVAIVYLVMLLMKANKVITPLEDTVKKLNLVLDDAKDITGDVKESADSAKKAVTKASNTVAEVSRVVYTNKGAITAVTSLLGVGAGLASLLGVSSKRKGRKKL